MYSDNIILSDSTIIYSAIITDYEKADFTDDILAGVRANYFNSDNSTQSDRTELEVDGERCYLAYSFKKGAAPSWKITRKNRPFQTVKKATGGVYCVITYGRNGIINKRQYFNPNHLWMRTEYYDKNLEGEILAVITPKQSDGKLMLCYEKFEADGNKTTTLLYPAKNKSNKKMLGLVYSDSGIVWFDARENESEKRENISAKSGFMFSVTNFETIGKKNPVADFDNAPYLTEEDILNLTSKTYDRGDTLTEEFSKDSNESFDFTTYDDEYSAYAKIEKILFEAHQTNKNLFGVIADQNSEGVGNGKAEGEALSAEAEETAEEKVTYKYLKEEPVDSVINTKSGAYAYYGQLDENNCRTGRGRTVTPEGITSYDGEYVSDKRHGFGVCYYKSGNVNYVGNWDNGERSGGGVGYRQTDGTFHAGKWNKNKPCDVGARFDSDGNFIDVCEYFDGVRNGKSVSFDEDGNVVIKLWENGSLVSEQIIRNGDI